MIYAVSKLDSPVGPLEIAATLRGIVRVRYVTWPVRAAKNPVCKRASAFAEEARLQMEEYLAGTRTHFNVPFDLRGTLFQQRVWTALMRVPFAARESYSGLALKLGKIGGAQAIGQAVKLNPIAIIIPCHRIVPSEGLVDSTIIGGYNGGSKRKAWLLNHELGALRQTLRRPWQDNIAQPGAGRIIPVNA